MNPFFFNVAHIYCIKERNPNQEMHVTNTEYALKILFNVRLYEVVEFYPYKDVFINKRNRRKSSQCYGWGIMLSTKRSIRQNTVFIGLKSDPE